MENQHIQIISAKSDSLKEYLLKIFRNRFLIQTLAKRDLKIKYAQMWLGDNWSLIFLLVK